MSMASATMTFKLIITLQDTLMIVSTTASITDNNLADWDALRRSLFSDQLVADHGIAKAGNHTWVLGQVYTSLTIKTSVDIDRLRETR